MAAGQPLAVILSEQNIPLILPDDDGKCAVIVRVEDCLLHKVNSALKAFAKSINPNGDMPPGSVILIGSLSHLGGVHDN
jgi:hypothetical protein